MDLKQPASHTVAGNSKVASIWYDRAYLDIIVGYNPACCPAPEDVLPKREPSPVAQLQAEYNQWYGIPMPKTSPEAHSDGSISTYWDSSRSIPPGAIWRPLILSSNVTQSQPEYNPVQITAAPKSSPKPADQAKPTQGSKKKNLTKKRKRFQAFTDTGIVCTECDEAFASRVGLTQHNQANHSGPRPYRCVQCGKRYQFLTELEAHKKRHTDVGKPFGCSECPKRFNFKRDMIRHFEKDHCNIVPFKCSKCNKRFQRRDSVLQHEVVCVGNPLKCKTCDQRFVRQGFFFRHSKKCQERFDAIEKAAALLHK
ncbi:zinc finger protein 273-like [Sabethes cyaneus]|uniref:zinc finger protein 273-like n=1 Tax=Sabethes cyaneus TaxID=53552 RepID=UPI00237D57FA|nr:zinc finger protein 273-like [Sabethes cyaneus]